MWGEWHNHVCNDCLVHFFCVNVLKVTHVKNCTGLSPGLQNSTQQKAQQKDKIQGGVLGQSEQEQCLVKHRRLLIIAHVVIYLCWNSDETFSLLSSSNPAILEMYIFTYFSDWSQPEKQIRRRALWITDSLHGYITKCVHSCDLAVITMTYL